MINKKNIQNTSIKVLITSLFFILAFYFKNAVNDFIYIYLTVDPNWSNNKVITFLLVTSLISIVYLYFHLISKKYLFSYTHFLLLSFSIASIFFLMSVREKWNFTKAFAIEGIRVNHVDIYLVFVIGFLIVGFLNSQLKNRKSENNLTFSEDNAFSGGNDNDLLNYLHIVEKIRNKVLNQNFQCSFTIGIIGPWGNGKSSFINLLANRLTDKNIIPVHFHPYLNHTETEISLEFFHAFQTALSPYSGKLSNLIIDYSNKLLNLYNDKKIGAFYNKEFIGTKSSAQDTLIVINETLKAINRKIVVFVDDLDRLNQDEILQVLKLIRNTANFTNTVFVVAMDKGYILNRLNTDNSISNNKFIDKFFQLEIYLPEIDKKILSQEFIRIIKQSTFINERTKIEFENLISQNKILFEDYIKNLRDVKRVCNQIIFEYDFVNEEIDLGDFINFIFLKLSFPKFLDLLKSNPANYLNKSGSYYNLKTKIDSETKGDLFPENIEITENIIEKYILHVELIDEKNFSDLEINHTYEEKKLLIKTLAYLFGEENNTRSLNSIKFENNFRRFMQLDYKPSNFLNKHFVDIISLSELKSLKTSVDNIIKNKQQIDLLDRLKHFHPNNIDEFKNTILLYATLLDSIGVSNLSEIEILRNLAVTIQLNISETEAFDDDTFAEWFKESILKSVHFNEITILKLFGYLFETTKVENFWTIVISDLEEILFNHFRKYLSTYNDKIWKVNDYTFYKIYSNIRLIGNINNRLVNEFKTFLNKNKRNLLTFCVQNTDYEIHYFNYYKIANGVLDFFESKQEYVKFIETHKDASSKEVKEYIDFLKLFRITNFSISIVYKFKDFDLFKEKYFLYNEASIGLKTSKTKEISQVFYKILDESVYEKLMKQSLLPEEGDTKLLNLKPFYYDNNYYLLQIDFENKVKIADKYMQLFYNSLKGGNVKEASLSSTQIKLNDVVVLEKFSVQPN